MSIQASPRAQEAPFFVVGAQRSGTTLLRLLLDHHPELAVPHEFDYVIEALPPGSGWPATGEFEALLERSGPFRRSGLVLDRSLSFPEQVEHLLRQHQGAKPRVGMVVHAVFERIPRLWPEARFVHLLRDPRDVAKSVIGMGWAGNVWTGAERWIGAWESWERMRSALDPGRFAELRYEDLVREPERELRRLCDFLGVAWSEQMFAYADATSYGRPDPSLAEQWRRKLSLREVRLVEARVGARLAAAGYSPSGLPPLRPGALARRALAVDDWARRVRGRFRKFGPALVLGDVAARRLGLRAAERAMQERIRAIADRDVK